MCGRFTLRTPLTVLAQQFQFDLDNALQLPLRYNIAPTQDVAAVRLVDGKRKLAMFRWGLIPSWAKDTKIASSTINARADTVATKPAFRSAYKRHRCLVLADGYYEWLRVGKAKPSQTGAESSARLPHFISTSLMNSYSVFVDGSSGVPRLALIRVWFVSWAPKTLAGIPVSFSTAPSRWACAELSGWSET